MSAKELLREFKALPVEQQKKFLREARVVGRARQPARKVEWPDVELRAKRIVGDRVLPNLILVERDESAF